MNKIAKFEKVTFDGKCFPVLIDQEIYDDIKLPKRATVGSAGYDFFAPFDIDIPYGESIVIPTGIRCKMDEGWVLCIFPRSGHGFKTGVSLANTVGIIDSDYYHASNEGHIMVKLTNNNGAIRKPLHICKGDAFCQGIFLPFGITEDDEATTNRVGGMGSTDKQE